MFVRIIY